MRRREPSRLRLRAIALGAAALAGCGGSGALLREHTYPPSFEYIDESRLQSAMWEIARDVEGLEQALGQPAGDPDAQQREVAAILRRMDASAGGIDPGGRVTQHPLLNRHLPRFREQIRRARADVARTPPRYFSAAALTGSCASCHGGGAP